MQINACSSRISLLRAKLTLMITLNFYHFIIRNHVICEPNLNQKQGLHLVGPGFRDLNSGNINLKNLIATFRTFCSGL